MIVLWINLAEKKVHLNSHIKQASNWSSHLLPEAHDIFCKQDGGF